jgi:dephospho-CoA kinase
VSSVIHRPYVVALTGGIASGKTTVAAAFETYGVPVIDADVVAREIVAVGTPALGEIVQAFGAGVLDAQGTLDRRAMRDIVFADAGARARIGAITHPRIRDVLHARTAASSAPYVILVVPLLVEIGKYEWVDRVLVVDVPRSLQRIRLLARDGVTEALADAMLDAQVSSDKRLAIADDIIVNEGRVEEIPARVAMLDASYRLLAAEKRGVRATDVSKL